MARCNNNNNRHTRTSEETKIYPRLIRDTCPNDCNSCKCLATFSACQVACSQLSCLFCFWFCNLFFEPCSSFLPILPFSDKTSQALPLQPLDGKHTKLAFFLLLVCKDFASHQDRWGHRQSNLHTPTHPQMHMQAGTLSFSRGEHPLDERCNPDCTSFILHPYPPLTCQTSKRRVLSPEKAHPGLTGGWRRWGGAVGWLAFLSFYFFILVLWRGGGIEGGAGGFDREKKRT